MTKTSIEWTDESWNPLRARLKSGRPGWHCVHVSDGCTNCYAEAINKRLGTGLGYRAQDAGAVETYLDEKVLTAPLRWKKPRKVFVCSMTDLFGEWVTDEQIDRVFAVMALCPQHTFQVLTKRAERMREYLSYEYRWAQVEGACDGLVGREEAPAIATPERRALGNVWLGVSVEDQQRADERIPLLRATPARVRWLSVEPMLEHVELSRALMPYNEPPIRWVVVGGESGPKARPCDVAWIRSIRDQCKAASVPLFVKQLGTDPINGNYREGELRLRDRKGGDPLEWPEDLRVRKWPR